jgi:hypothetical protein
MPQFLLSDITMESGEESRSRILCNETAGCRTNKRINKPGVHAFITTVGSQINRFYKYSENSVFMTS